MSKWLLFNVNYIFVYYMNDWIREDKEESRGGRKESKKRGKEIELVNLIITVVAEPSSFLLTFTQAKAVKWEDGRTTPRSAPFWGAMGLGSLGDKG